MKKNSKRVVVNVLILITQTSDPTLRPANCLLESCILIIEIVWEFHNEAH